MKNTILKPSKGLVSLVTANAPYWGAEAEVIRSYWNSPVRNMETDKKWLIHQIYKEYCNGVKPYLEMLNNQLAQIRTKEQRLKLMEFSEIVYEEVEHFSMFADLHEVLLGKDYNLSPDELKLSGSWSENDALMGLRKQHYEQSPEIGQRATSFTEGGYVALFAEGMKLAGGSEFDNEIAAVCKKIYDDEFHHMLLGVIETDSEELSESEWVMLENFTIEQMKKRIVMRNAQFSHPVSDKRVEELLDGKAAAIEFDFNYAARLLNNEAA